MSNLTVYMLSYRVLYTDSYNQNVYVDVDNDDDDDFVY